MLDLKTMKSALEQLETEQSNINTQLADGDLYATQAVLVKNLQARLTEIERQLEKLLARWEVLDSK